MHMYCSKFFSRYYFEQKLLENIIFGCMHCTDCIWETKQRVKTTLECHTLPDIFSHSHDLGQNLTSDLFTLQLQIFLRKLSSKAKVTKTK